MSVEEKFCTSCGEPAHVQPTDFSMCTNLLVNVRIPETEFCTSCGAAAQAGQLPIFQEAPKGSSTLTGESTHVMSDTEYLQPVIPSSITSTGRNLIVLGCVAPMQKASPLGPFGGLVV
jgi:NMD protein affecting ribosome stability and mRNA decay